MSQGGLRGFSALGSVGGGALILLAAGCEPPAPIINYSGPRLHVRTPADGIKLFRSGPPDRGYLETGTVEIRCTSERSSSGLASTSARGCSYDRALSLARQHASEVGADGLFNISPNSATSGNVATLRATAFRYSSMGEEFPELAPTGDRLATAADPQLALAQPPPMLASPTGQPTVAQPATALDAQPSFPGAPPPAVTMPPMPPIAPLPPVAPQPVISPMRTAAPQPAMASTRGTTPQPPFPPLRAAGPISAPVATPAPEPVITPGATQAGAATLLPAEERLMRLKELRDKQMIPVEIYDRRRKEILQEMQKNGR